MTLKKFNLIYIVALLVGLVLIVSISFQNNTSVTFYGFAENQETQINMGRPVEVDKIHVTIGQKVKKGDALLDVFSSMLPVQINDAEYSIEELKTEYAMWKSEIDGQILESTLMLDEKTSDIQAEIDEYKAALQLNKKLASNLQSFEIDTLQVRGIKNPLVTRIETLEEELEGIKNNITSQITRLKKERNATNNPLFSRIKILEKELEYFNLEKGKETILAPTDGLIGSIGCKEDEIIAPFSTLITFYQETPTLVKGYIHEDLILTVDINDSVTVFSTSRPDVFSMGVVKTLGSRIVEIPTRIRKIKELETFGREVIIEIPPNNPFLQKEKVTLTVNK